MIYNKHFNDTHIFFLKKTNEQITLLMLFLSSITLFLFFYLFYIFKSYSATSRSSVMYVTSIQAEPLADEPGTSDLVKTTSFEKYW